jgi:hypothetical protein
MGGMNREAIPPIPPEVRDEAFFAALRGRLSV